MILFSTQSLTIVKCDVFVLILLIFFFFFKQKTAYEMRISDWSSDVCSSDLYRSRRRPAERRRAPHAGPAPGGRRRRRARALCNPAAAPEGDREIGRASCRERVCQYV